MTQTQFKHIVKIGSMDPILDPCPCFTQEHLDVHGT